ncbi:response regulator [Paenibacillus psychroresistens]|nr:response regulator [Paenibacillus psychroresistens]
MHRMLIVDDNLWDQEGIAGMLDWGNMDIEIVGICSNGKEGLEQARILNPDLILSDITMPIMDGIEMADKVRQFYPEVKIILMSCHDEFDFARAAVRLDVQDYVLKPIVAEYLESAIKKALNKHDFERSLKKEKEMMLEQLNQSLPSFQEQFLRELLFGYYHEADEIRRRFGFLKMEISRDCNIYLVSVVLGEYEKIRFDVETDDEYFTAYTVKRILQKCNNEHFSMNMLQISNKEFVLLLTDNATSPRQSTGDFSDLIIASRDEISSLLNLKIRIGISQSSQDLSDVPKLYQQSVRAAKTKFYKDGNDIVLFAEIEHLQSRIFEKSIDIEVLYNEVEALIGDGNEDSIEAFFVKYFGSSTVNYSENYVKSLAFSIANIAQLILIEANQSSKILFNENQILWERLSEFSEMNDVKMWIRNILKSVNEHLYSTNPSHVKVADEIKAIIKNKYHEQITAGDIAKSVYLSVVHANNVFKGLTGKTIFEYLTEYRIDWAKKMLKDPSSRIYIVAEKVGYSNKSYFCLLFKKITGLTPGEYKNKPHL